MIIGGYAVLAHGYVRATDDLDLLVRQGERAGWRQLLESCGLVGKHETATFMQFEATARGQIDVDLMFVSSDVFARRTAAAMTASVQNVPTGVVGLVHLVALNCHALRHSQSLRRLKDLDDLLHLITINRLDLNEPELRATILKHGDHELYEKLRFACAAE